METLSPGQSELYLRKDQNFFGQKPFNYLEAVAENRKLDISKLRALLPYVNRFEQATGLTGLTDDEAKEIMSQKRGMIDNLINEANKDGITGRLRSGGGAAGSRGGDRYLPRYYHFRDAFVEISLYLKDFPKWHEYMEEYTGRFKPWARTGNPSTNFRWFTGLQAPTYFQWPTVKDQEQRRKAFLEERERRRQVLLGIDEIFPDSFATQESVRESVSRGGFKRNNRNWKMLKGSELIKGK
ncbi:hypothetical protein C4559_01220 [Candidatus Microgenomates bacterium]|nr:MAG: hypothetical protein C4559_01220 [Candidatus Microgenomates bacterium]